MTFLLVNSIVLGNSVTAAHVLPVNVAFNPDPGNFQPTGAGNYYLAPTSPLHNAGTATISPRLQSELQAKTTYPPVVIADFTTNSGSMTLAPQAPRYVGGAPDLGWYYDALDYTVADMILNGGTLAVLPGTAIGYRMDTNSEAASWTYFGFDVQANSSLISQGTPNHPNVFVDVQQVQEQFAWPIWAGIVPDYFPTDPGSQPPVLNFRFSKFRLNRASYLQTPPFQFWSGADPSSPYEWSYNSAMYLTLQDCDLRGGQISLGQPAGYGYENVFWGPGMVSWINNSFDNVAINVDPSYYWEYGYTNVDMAFSAYNNLFRGGLWFHLEPIPASAGNWVLNDNLFDQVNIVQDTAAPLNFSNNGYWPLSTNAVSWDSFFNPWWWIPNNAKLQPTATSDGSHEVTLGSAPPYHIGPFGNFYLPTTTALYGAGSRSPAAAGLYHYTTRLDQVKEGNEAAGHNVNIGLHYVATAGPGSSQPNDYDGDGIFDYVENWHGDGQFHNDGTETDWQHNYSTVGPDGITLVADPSSPVYDDIDLSGDGLVGRIKNALGMSPFDPSNPLTPTQVITGQEPDIVTFEVPISYNALTNIGGLNLNINGIDVTLEDYIPATDGNCLVNWNTTYDPPGQYYLQAQLTLSTFAGDTAILSGVGNLTPFYSSNVLQFFESDAMYDTNGAYLDAQLTAQNATYSIALYDPSTTPATLLTTINNSTANGMIQEDWGVTNADGTPFSGAAVQAVFNVTLLNQSGGTAMAQQQHSKSLNRIVTREHISPPCMMALTWSISTRQPIIIAHRRPCSITERSGTGMLGVVDTLTMPNWTYDVYYSYFNNYGCPSEFDGYPGYLTSRAAVTNTLYSDLGNGTTKNFYGYGHGNKDYLGTRYRDVFMTAPEVAKVLANQFNSGSICLTNPYRFVFLDGCSTASGKQWRQAFGIMEPYETNQAARPSLGPQAYVGWGGFKADYLGGSYINGSLDIATSKIVATAYTGTLQWFFMDWMNGRSLAQCIRNASATNLAPCAFPIPGNIMVPVRAGYQTATINNGTNTSLIYVVGHSGLTVTGLAPGDDNQFPSRIDVR